MANGRSGQVGLTESGPAPGRVALGRGEGVGFGGADFAVDFGAGSLVLDVRAGAGFAEAGTLVVAGFGGSARGCGGLEELPAVTGLGIKARWLLLLIGVS
jgi:hypothetical protein